MVSDVQAIAQGKIGIVSSIIGAHSHCSKVFHCAKVFIGARVSYGMVKPLRLHIDRGQDLGQEDKVKSRVCIKGQTVIKMVRGGVAHKKECGHGVLEWYNFF